MVTNRRQILQAIGLSTLGVAGVTVAGCAPAKPIAGTGDGTHKTATEFHGGWGYFMAPQGNYNLAGQPFVGVPNAILMDGFYRDVLAPPSALYHWKEQTWELLLAESYSLDKASNTYTVKIKPDLVWSDGKPLTSNDYLTTFWVQWAMNSPLWTYVKDIAAPDEHTFTLTMNRPALVVERYLLHSNIIPSSLYQEFADRAKKLHGTDQSQTSSEAGQLTKDVMSFTPKRYVVSGPYTIDYDTITSTQISLVRNPTGYAAKTVNFDKIVLYSGETAVVSPLVLSKDIDYAGHAFPVASVLQFEKIGYKILRSPTYAGPALMFNFSKVPEFKDPRVRQAINYAFDHSQNGAAALGPSGVAPKLFTGFSDNLADQWLEPGAADKLIDYSFNQAKAAELLTQAGWHKNKSGWKLPNGKPAEYQLLFPSDYADWSAASTNLANQLGDFGIKLILHGVIGTQEAVNIDKGEFELGIQSWGNSTQPYPYFSYVQALFTHNYPIAKNSGGRGIDFDLVQTVPGIGKVDLVKLIEASGTGIDLAAVQKNVTTLARVFNAMLPIIPLFERHGNAPSLNGKRVKAFPTNDDPITQNSLYADNEVIVWLLNGKLQPVA